MQKMSTVTERPSGRFWGISSTLILTSLVNVEVCQIIKTRKCVKCDV